MIDLFVVFSKNGVVLWCFRDPAVKVIGTPVNELVQKVLIEQRGADEDAFLSGLNAVEYRTQNDMDLVFAAVYQKSLQGQLTYVGTLLDKLRATFVKKFGNAAKENVFQNFDFSNEFKLVRQAVEDASRLQAQAPKKKVMKSFEDTKKFKKSQQHNEELQSGKLKKLQQERAEARAAAEDAEDDDDIETTEETEEEKVARKLKELGLKTKGGSKASRRSAAAKESPTKSKREKKADARELSKVELDFSDSKAQHGDDNDYDDLGDMVDGREILDLDSDMSAKATAATPSKGLFSFFSSLSGGTTITDEMLAPVLDKMRLHLIGKNVASDIAEKICAGVAEGLVGTAKGTFSGVASIVRDSIEATLTNILSPKRRVDILRDIIQAKKENRPYVVTFCGVNGVGKSTNLAKTCYWLLQNENSVLIAACDTFRAGAVEQLRTHVRKLNAAQKQTGRQSTVTLFEKGYGKDAAGIAGDAIAFARDAGHNVVLVDTAGRMQDNEPLMRALSKLVNMNKPDLVLFVGEALVGNEAVDQLSKFNKALADHSNEDNPRGIDGIVLTKFDTIDDKVGAAISMTYITGQPVVFVGTGQTYGDLKKLNVKSVVAALLT